MEEKVEKESLPGERQNLVKKANVIFLKASFCIGVSSVTRTLERMPKKDRKSEEIPAIKLLNSKESEGKERGLQHSMMLQAVVVAMDVHPRVLVSHLGPLCSSRAVPMLPISGGDGSGSLRLGELLGLRTAMAVGVKTGTSAINMALQSILSKGI